MKQYLKPEISITKFEVKEAFAATGDEVFGAGSGAEDIPVSEFTYNAEESTLDGWIIPGLF